MRPRLVGFLVGLGLGLATLGVLLTLGVALLVLADGADAVLQVAGSF